MIETRLMEQVALGNKQEKKSRAVTFSQGKGPPPVMGIQDVWPTVRAAIAREPALRREE